MRLTQLTQWHSCLDLGDSGSTRRARAQAIMGTGEMALLGLFPSLWPLCPSEDQARRWCSCLGHGEPGSTRYAGKPVATGTADMVPVESSSSFWQLAFKGLSGWSFFVAWHSRCSRAPLADVLICWSACQALRGHPPGVFLCWAAAGPCRWGEGEVVVTAALPSPAETLQSRLASLAAQLSSKGLPCRDLPPHTPGALSPQATAVYTLIALQSPRSSSQP